MCKILNKILTNSGTHIKHIGGLSKEYRDVQMVQHMKPMHIIHHLKRIKDRNHVSIPAEAENNPQKLGIHGIIWPCSFMMILLWEGPEPDIL